VDVDGDTDLDLALTGSRTDGTHVVMRNLLPPGDAARGVQVRVVDDQNRAVRAGTEVRVFAPGSSRLLGARLVDSGSGYNSQNDLPVHFGLPTTMARVDLQIIIPRGGKRTPIWLRGTKVDKPWITVRTN
jgi:hypothetical protein